MKKAFTLVELLVVIGIIGILMAVLVGNFFGGRESARAAACLANMKNLGNACQAYGMTSGSYPRAGSCEKLTISAKFGGGNKSYKSYSETKGWISWDSRGNYPGGSRQDSVNNPLVSLYSTDKDAVQHALTNGVIWAYVARNSKTYVCPSHVKARNAAGKSKPNWSYLMNSYFGNTGTKPSPMPTMISYMSLSRADRSLLFSEVPFMGYSSWQPDGSGASTSTDAVLRWEDGETIGANHIDGKNLFAHVCFADGHTEKLKIPYSGKISKPKADATQLKNLTEWLCCGKDITYSNSKYQKLTD